MCRDSEHLWEETEIVFVVAPFNPLIFCLDVFIEPAFGVSDCLLEGQRRGGRKVAENLSDVSPPVKLRNVRLLSPDADGLSRTAFVAVGLGSAEFQITTKDEIPDAFAFLPVTVSDMNVATGDWVSSAPVTLSGYASPIEIVVSGAGNPQISVNGGAFASSVTAPPDASIVVRLEAPPASTSAEATVTAAESTAADFTVEMEHAAPEITTAELSDGRDDTAYNQHLEASFHGGAVTDTWSASGLSAAGLSLNGSTGAITGTPYAGMWPVDVTLVDTLGGTATRSFTISVADTVPDAFAFAAHSGVPLDTQIASADAVVTGIDASVAVSVSGDGSPQVSIAGGAWATSGTVTNGQTVAVRLTSSSAEAETRTATVDIGGVTADFDVTTADATPDAFVIAAVNDADFNTYISSAAVTPSGFDTNVSVSLSGHGSAGFRVDNGSGYGAWRVSPASLAPGGQVQVRLMSDGVSSSARVATLTIGGVSANFTVTTGDATPDAFAFASLTAQPLNTLVTSAPVTISGLGIAAPVNVSGDGSPQISVNGGAWTTSATVSNGQSIRVRLTTANAEATNHAAMVDIGGVMGVFVATTIDATPEAFAFTAQTGVELSYVAWSNQVTLTGFGGTVPVSVSGQGSPEFRIYTGSWGAWRTSPATVESGDRVQVRLTSAGGSNTTRTATLTVGSVSANFVVTTGDATPNAFAFAAKTAVARNTLTASTPIVISGLDIPAPVSISGSGASYRVKSGGVWGSWTSTASTISNGDELQAWFYSASTEATTTSTTVTIGGVSANFTVTTADMTPANFSFTAKTDVALSTLTASNGPTISGIDTAVSVSVSGQGSPQFRVHNGSGWSGWGTASTTIQNGYRVQVRLTSAGSGNTTRTATLTVGSLSRNFSVTTGAAGGEWVQSMYAADPTYVPGWVECTSLSPVPQLGAKCSTLGQACYYIQDTPWGPTGTWVVEVRTCQ